MCCSSPSMTNSPGSMAKIRSVLVKLALVQRVVKVDSENVTLIGRYLVHPVSQLALIVAQERDKANNLSGIYLSALDEGLQKIYVAAKRRKGRVTH